MKGDHADPTFDAVMRREQLRNNKVREDNKYNEMARTIKRILDNNGYELNGPIAIINMANGRKRRIY